MNTGQMLLATGAIVLLGITVLTVNRSFNSQGIILEQTEIGTYATSLATSIVDEASSMAFDEATVNSAVSSQSSCISDSKLGTDVGEKTNPQTTVNFDDFDDYNNLKEGVKVAGVDSFTVNCQVYYVNPSAPNTNIHTQSFFKRLDVQVWSQTSLDTVRMSYIFSYIMFR